MQLLLSIRPINRRMLATLALLLATACVHAIARQVREDPDIVDDVPQANAAANIVDFQVNDATFDQWVFGNSMQVANASAARLRIESSLDLQIAALNGACPITDLQKKKLRLAGRGDIKRFFDQVEEKRSQFQLVKKDRNKFGQFYQEVIPLQTTLNMGLFREGSLFFKTMQSTLDADQAIKFGKLQEERRQFGWRAKVELVADMWTNTLGLSDDRRRRLVEVIVSEIKTPKVLGQLDYYFVMYKLSRMPKETLRPIFEEAQWKLFERQVNQAKGFRMLLTQQGYDRDDLADPEEKKK